MDAIDRVNMKLKQMFEYLKILKGFRGVTVEELKKNAERRGAIERYMQLVIETVLDVANILNAEYRYPAADTNEELILTLGKEGVLDEEFAREFCKVGSFRNLLVHDYAEIDYKMVVENLNQNLGDFERFAREVAEFLVE